MGDFSVPGYKPHAVHVTLDTPMPPPRWALLERQLIAAQSEACREFYDRYFDERGQLLCVPRWGGDDGPDDAAENQLNWTVLHALGADDDILDLFRHGFEGHLQQYTEAKTVEVPLARDGMYYKEFPVSLDWFHHGEGFSAFFHYGLSDPYDVRYQQRACRYAGLYMNEDPQASNYDPQKRIIRSLFNGSRGPLMRKATDLDWTGDPIEVEGRFSLNHNERSYAEMLEHFREYTDIVGDHPINMGATQLGITAYALTGEEKYREWLLEYVDAWVERTEKNNGIIPSNIGLDGTIGGECDGKWWGGCYGWGFSVTVPQTGQKANRPAVYSRPFYGFANALLMTGQQSYVDTWRGVIDKVNANSSDIDGITMYPRMHGDDGWYAFEPTPFNAGALPIWFWSQDAQDATRVANDEWVSFVRGGGGMFPEKALESDLETLRRRVELMRTDTTTPDTRLSDDMNPINPAITENLTRLMLGGLPTGRDGHALHCRLRYFDADRRRAGLPEDVGALVEQMDADNVIVSLVNCSPIHQRTVVVQGGAYAEHGCQVVADGKAVPETSQHFDSKRGSAFVVRLAPGCGGKLQVRQQRYVHLPTFAFPWDRP
tara:strand:- start:2165 stop:3967 length:1803 start_codon:yes stop_codon:yes gene_type:complete